MAYPVNISSVQPIVTDNITIIYYGRFYIPDNLLFNTYFMAFWMVIGYIMMDTLFLITFRPYVIEFKRKIVKKYPKFTKIIKLFD